jgi:hypothetical protein
LFPAAHALLARKRDHGRGEAALIALAAAEKKLADDARLLRAWRNWHHEELEAALARPHGAVIGQLMQILHELTLQSAPVLLEFVRAQHWKAVDYDSRLTALHEVNTAIMELRERNGMPPFDDRLDRRANVFQLIRAIIVN